MTRNRWLALAILCAALLMTILDQTIVNVALPAIQTDLRFSTAGLAWVVNAYLIPFGGVLLLAGRLGDLLGRRRMFLTGLTVFTATSVLAGSAWSPAALLVARFAQGVGGAMMSAVILGMVVTMFPEPRELAKAIAVFSFVGSAGGSIGFLAGGFLTQAANWHWIFFVNVPIGVATMLLTLRYVPAGAGSGRGADVLSAALVTSGLMAVVYAIVTGSPLAGAAGAVLLVAFVVRQARAANPLLPLRIFRAPNVSAANLIQVLMVGSLFGFQFLVTMYLQHVLHYDAAQIGLAILPAPLVIGVLTLSLSARLNTRLGERPVLAAGLVLISAGLALLARVPVDGVYLVDVLPALVVLGVGFGLAFPAMMTLAMSGADPADSGLASGLVNTTQQVGGALGLAALATLAAARTDALTAGGIGAAEAMTAGYHLGFWIGSALVATAVVITLTLIRPRAVSGVSEVRVTVPA